jgi:hypothetical protein
MIEISIACLILGAAWQWWDGHGWLLPTLARLGVAGLIVGLALWSTGLPILVSIICGVVALLNTHMGYTKWESYKWMIPRFGVPALVVFLLTGSWLYPLLCATAGAIYPLLYNVNRGEEIARLPRGAAILGGLSLIPYMSVGPWVSWGI